MGHIYTVCGKKTTEVEEIGCGDIGAVAKLVTTKTDDTLSMSVRKVMLEGVPMAKPCYAQGIEPKSKGNEEKMSTGLAKLRDEDPSFEVNFNPETKQMVIAGAGDIHLDVICSKLKSKFGVEVTLTPPIVPYREKIRKKVSVEGKHRNSRAAMVSMVTSRWTLSRTPKAITCSKKRSSAVRFRRTSIRRSIRASAKPWNMACWPVIRWLA